MGVDWLGIHPGRDEKSGEGDVGVQRSETKPIENLFSNFEREVLPGCHDVSEESQVSTDTCQGLLCVMTEGVTIAKVRFLALNERP